jgi:DME family drug/metabolite transporter
LPSLPIAGIFNDYETVWNKQPAHVAIYPTTAVARIRAIAAPDNILNQVRRNESVDLVRCGIISALHEGQRQVISFGENVLTNLGVIQGEYVALFCAFIWAGSQVLVTPVAQREGALRLVGVRAALTSLALLLLVPLFVNWRDIASVSPTTFLVFFFVVAPFLGVGSVLLFAAVEEIGVARAFPISSSYPLLTTLAAVVFLRERPTLGVAGGTLMVIAGISLISISHIQPSFSSPLQQPLFRTRGFWYALLAAVAWTVSTMVMKVGLESGVHPVLAELMRMPGVVALIVATLRLKQETRSMWSISRGSWVAIMGSSVLGQVIGDVLYMGALQSSIASTIVPLSATSPVWTVPLAYIFLKERINWMMITGILLSVVGVVLILQLV